jgi:hypothetical protein
VSDVLNTPRESRSSWRRKEEEIRLKSAKARLRSWQLEAWHQSQSSRRFFTSSVTHNCKSSRIASVNHVHAPRMAKNISEDPKASRRPDELQYEQVHVHSVYETIASHFSSTRYKVSRSIQRCQDDGLTSSALACRRCLSARSLAWSCWPRCRLRQREISQCEPGCLYCRV